MNKFNHYSLVALKGFGMGAANVVPGVSGGTIALLTGIYSEIVDSLNSVTDKKTWKALFSLDFRLFWKCINGSFLLALMAGVLLSVLSLAKLVTWTLTYYPVLTWAFFFGLILSSTLVLFCQQKNWTATDVLFVVSGLALGVVVCTLSPTTTTNDMWFIFLCGAISICTMILPGISGSFILLILGKYDYIMQAVSDLNFPVLLVFGAGCVIGILAFAKFLHWLLARWERQTLLVLLGFVAGSLVKVWPWADRDAVMQAQVLRGGDAALIDPQILPAVLWCLGGIALVALIEIMSKKMSERAE